MLGDRRERPNACMYLFLQAFLLQGIALRLESNQDEQEASRGGNLAVCISGGLRQGDECAESHVRSIVEASRTNFNHVKIFFATWSNRQCIDDDFPPVNESFIRGLYPNEDMDVWIGDQPESEWGQDDVTQWPFYWSQYMFHGCRNMASLWQKCMDMIPDTYDVIVRTRPDWCFPDSYRLVASPRSVRISRPARTNKYFIAHLEEDKVFMPKNYHHTTDKYEIPDDRMGFGLAEPMKRAFGTLVQRADQHDFDLTDNQYYFKWGKPDLEGDQRVVLNPRGFWAREPYPELVLAHHLSNMNINVTLIEPEDLSLWEVGTRGILCGSNLQHGKNESIPARFQTWVE